MKLIHKSLEKDNGGSLTLIPEEEVNYFVARHILLGALCISGDFDHSDLFSTLTVARLFRNNILSC